MDNKKSQKLLLVSAVLLLLFFVVSVGRVAAVAKEMEKENPVLEEEPVDESAPRQVRACDECLAKYKNKIYSNASGAHSLVVDNLNFRMFCTEHLATQSIKEASYSGVLHCYVGNTDVRDFEYYKENGKEYFVSEDQYLKLVYDEAQGKWSTYTKSPNVIKSVENAASDSGVWCAGIHYDSLKELYVDGWVPLYEYYEEENYNAAHEAYLQEEEKKEQEKADKIKRTSTSLQAGENTVTIHSVEGYLPVLEDKEEPDKENTLLMIRAESYEDIVNYDYNSFFNIRYGIKDTLEEEAAGYTHNKTYETYQTIKQTVVEDPSGNEVIQLDTITYGKKFREGIDDSEAFVRLCDYVLENNCSMQEACNALGVEYTAEWEEITGNIENRKFCKKLENGMYLYMTPENIQNYQIELIMMGIAASADVPDEFIEFAQRYETMNDDKIMQSYQVDTTVLADEFIKYLGEDCYTFK